MLHGGEGLPKAPRGSRGRVHTLNGSVSAGAAPLGFSERGVRLICSTASPPHTPLPFPLPQPEDGFRT